MAITMNFAQEFSDLICEDVSLIQCETPPESLQIPEKYRKNFVHTPNGFVKLFCEEMENNPIDIRGEIF